MKMFRLLELIEERKANDSDKLLCIISAASCPDFKCILFNELKVRSNRIIKSRDAKDDKKETVIAILVQPCDNSDYSKCLTVKDLKEFLNKIEDKNEQICVCTQTQINDGQLCNVINAYPSNEFSKADNAFYLWI